MPAERIARRTVAFFLLTSATSVIALILVGVGLSVGVFAGRAPLTLTLIPAAVAAVAILAAITAGRLAQRVRRRLDQRHPGHISRASRMLGALAQGVEETLALAAEHNPSVVLGAIGYLAFDVMIVWATFHAYGSAPPLAIVWIAYLIGQLGGILPLPGGAGGVDGGLIAAYAVYGVPVGSATAAVLSYRLLALWIPAVMGTVAFVGLRRRVRLEADRFAVCHPGDEINVGLGPIRAWSAAHRHETCRAAGSATASTAARPPSSQPLV